MGFLKRWANRSLERANSRLEKQVADLQATVEARDRTIQVLEAERDALAGVIARDRMRVASESAIHARTKAEAEGVTDERDYQSTGRRIA